MALKAAITQKIQKMKKTIYKFLKSFIFLKSNLVTLNQLPGN